jgi:hypothetical protein
MNRLRVFLIATCLVAVTPPLFGDIILVSRQSDAEASACGHPGCQTPPPQSQTGFLPATLCNTASGFNHCPAIGPPCDCSGTATSLSNSSILINNPTNGLRVVGDGTARASGCLGISSARLIVLSFALTEVTYPYSMTGQLNGSNATAKLTGETGTIFEKVGTTTLSESGTLPPGNYTLSVNVDASVFVGINESDANFAFALDGPMSTPTPTPIPATRATNLSTRLLVGTGNDVGIGGFIVTGNGPRHLLIRGIGPSLSGMIPNTLSDPSLQVYGSNGCFQTLTNNNWRDTQEAEIIGTGRAPGNDLESAILADLAPGSYTAVLGGIADTTGVGLVEIYDLTQNQESSLANVSTRGNVRTGDDIMIAGFILGAGDGGEDAIIVRGIGPSLYGFSPETLLSDPRLELRDINGQLIIANDNWMDDPTQAAIIQAAGLAPTNSLESAIAATLMPGPYTALLFGVNNGTGVGLVEVYDRGASANRPSNSSDSSGRENCVILRESAK